MTRKQRIEQLEYEVLELKKKVNSIDERLGYVYYNNIEEYRGRENLSIHQHLNLIFDYFDIEITKTPERIYIEKRKENKRG